MMKRLYLLRAFLFTLLAIFMLLIRELYFFDLHRKIISVSFLVTIFLIFIFWVLSVYSFYRFSLLINREAITKETDRLQLEESMKLIQTLSSQRHDFRNQLQVIKVLAQFNKNEEIVQYIHECNFALDFSNTVFGRIENPVLSAMFLSFATEAKEKGIAFNVDSDIEFSRFKLSPYKMTRILGNIIRNAIEVLSVTRASDRSIQVTMWENEENYCFQLSNNGPVIPEEQMNKIFKAGFSTKNSTGLGLVIVQELVAAMNGKIIVKSTAETGTEFKIILSKNQPPESQTPVIPPIRTI